MLLRLPHLALTNLFAVVRLPPMSDTNKDIEILALRHQLVVLQRQIDKPTPPAQAATTPPGRLPRHRPTLAPRPTTPPGRPPTHRRIQTLVQRLARESPSRGYRRIHSEPAMSAIKVAPSTVWEILHRKGIQPAPQRDRQTRSTILHSQTQAILAADFFETHTLTGVRLYIFAVIEHATRRVRVLGATAHPTTAWTTQLARNLVMDLHDAGATTKYLARDRDSRYATAFDTVFENEGIAIVKTGIRVPRMNAIMERRVRSRRAERLDRTLIVNLTHLRHALREYESFYNEHRSHRTLRAAAPLRPLPQPIIAPKQLNGLDVRRRDRLGGILHEYQRAA
ncbi:integrase core domain-containing protein [Nonomuraea angiospora]|uniref:integrase core domain-containing protein n=1 Tax=Nonomuraea angiospora TaxID=46172 RepID=UPI0034175D10